MYYVYSLLLLFAFASLWYNIKYYDYSHEHSFLEKSAALGMN